MVFQALNKFQTSHKVTTKTGIEQEESLLSETAALETSLNSQILDLENDLNKVNEFIRPRVHEISCSSTYRGIEITGTARIGKSCRGEESNDK